MKLLNVKYLPDIITTKGFKYRKLASTQNHSIFEQECGGRVVAYEVGRRKYRKPVPHFKGDSGYDVIEEFWKDEDFGTLAHSYPPDKEKAFEYYAQLTKTD